MGTYSIRHKVIDDAIEVEHLLKDILKNAFRIIPSNKKLKAFGVGRQNLPAQSRLDILDDLGFLEKRLYDEIILVFQIRNKFAHLKECRTFLDLKKLDSGAEFLKTLSRKLDLAEELRNAEEGYILYWNFVVYFVIDELKLLNRELIAGMMDEFERYLASEIFKQFGPLLKNHDTLFFRQNKEVELDMAKYLNSLLSFIQLQYIELGKSIDVINKPELFEQIFKKRGDYEDYIAFSKMVSEPLTNHPESQSPSSESHSDLPGDTPSPPATQIKP